MFRLLSDQNLNGRIVRGLRRRMPNVDLIRATDVGLASAEDPDLLEWAAAETRILLTHDVNTIPGFAFARVRSAKPMPGVFLVAKSMPIGQAIDELELAVKAQTPEECKDQVIYFPL